MKTIFLIFVMVACASARVDPDVPSGTRWPRWQFPECRRPRSLMYDAVVGGEISQLGGGCHAPTRCSVHHQGFCRLPLLLCVPGSFAEDIEEECSPRFVRS